MDSALRDLDHRLPGPRAEGAATGTTRNIAIAIVASTLSASALVTPVSTAAQGIAPGEETRFSVSYLGIPTGEGVMRVGDPEGDIWPVILQARTTGAAKLFDIREHLVTYWDARRRLSLGSDLEAYEVGIFHTDSLRFDRIARKATAVEQRRGFTPDRTVLDVPEGALDLAAAFIWLRAQTPTVGQRLEIPVVIGTSQFTMVANVIRREVVRTAAGEFPSFEIRVRTGFDGKFSSRRELTLWLADSATHHFVRASAEFAVGSMVAELKSYSPGRPVASASQ